MMTPKDIEEVHRAAETWRLNDERTTRLEAEKLDKFEKTRPVVTEKMLERVKKLAKELYY